ncbi:hypothetical protein GUJ93_ZPchr0008g13446 [Zizania palustris]|uniref:Uncharacterized protein n=1 Tax=Zizania palustris TaxID=103762 RepID=A0A8J5RE61_ZIZPA|nr:hypothetical protein GUJ93_ZPchr0008g13446 [Zizania palustris]
MLEPFSSLLLSFPASPNYHKLLFHLNLQLWTEQGSEEQGKKDMKAFNKVIDKVKSNPEVGKVKEEVISLAHALHLGKHEKKTESEEKAKEGETAQNVGESASASNTEEDSGVVEQAVEEIQAVVSAVQQHQLLQTDGAAPGATSEAAAETSAEGDNARDVEKDDPKKRLGLAGFFAMLFERFCSPGNKKKD